MLVREDVNQAFAGSLTEGRIAAMNVPQQGLHESVVYLRHVEEMETLGEIVQEGSVLSPKAHHQAHCLVVGFELGQKLLIDKFPPVFGEDNILGNVSGPVRVPAVAVNLVVEGGRLLEPELLRRGLGGAGKVQVRDLTSKSVCVHELVLVSLSIWALVFGDDHLTNRMFISVLFNYNINVFC